MNKKIILPAFVILCLAQLYIPYNMISRKEKVWTQGKEFRFKTEPIDPSDPFRGKYINLSFAESSIVVPNADDWIEGNPIYVNLGEDEKGFAKILSASKEKPEGTDFVEAVTGYVYSDSTTNVTIHFPFDRFYMEESKAYNAELAYAESARDTMQITYALVAVKDGDAVVKDVLINGIPIREVAKNYKENQFE
ncbi:MAG: GDYXXLXY domain-containing protein [Saprospiraceae bacterium]